MGIAGTGLALLSGLVCRLPRRRHSQFPVERSRHALASELRAPSAQTDARHAKSAGAVGRRHRLGLVTSGDRNRVTRQLREYRLTQIFHARVCGGDTANKKPHPEPLLKALSQMKVDPLECVYVGDTPEDLQMARAAGVCAIAVLGPFPTEKKLRGGVEMWRGGVRCGLSVAGPFVCRCLTSLTMLPFPHPAHRTGYADFPLPALGERLTMSPTGDCASAC